MEQPETRRLAAIMFTDIVGFSAYPNNPAALNAMRAQAKWRKAR